MLTIDLIAGNSGKGSPVFSKLAKQQNTLIGCFKNPQPDKILREESDHRLDKEEILEECKEIKFQDKFEVRRFMA